MGEDDLIGGGREPALGRHRALTPRSEARLRSLGERLPPMSQEELDVLAAARRERLQRTAVTATAVTVVVAVLALAGVQWARPLPAPAFRPAGSRSVRLAGSSPVLPWPATGSADVAVVGVGSLGRSGSASPVPIAGLASVLTAYVVLHDHPLRPYESGPAIPVTSATLAAFDAGQARQEPEVPVAPGEVLSERQALEGLLVDSGADMATLLAGWDAGTTAAFTARMNTTARSLGMRATRITDPSGLRATTVSTASDLVALGEAAMAVPALRQIALMGEARLPMAGLVYNLNFDLGQDGIVGVETGSDAAADGCYLFAAQQTVAGRTVTVVGSVLGQRGVSPNTAAVDAGDQLARAAFSAVGARPLAGTGQVVGSLVAPWGASAPVAAVSPAVVVGWGGLRVGTGVRLGTLPSPVPAGRRVGLLRVRQGAHTVTVGLRATRTLAGPSALWRLTRL